VVIINGEVVYEGMVNRPDVIGLRNVGEYLYKTRCE
jgi:hypothetical protein